MGSAWNLIQYGKLRQKTNLLVYEMYSLKDMKEDLKGDWVKVPSLEIAFGRVFEVGSASQLIQHVKLCTCTNFHACIIKCTIHPIFEVKRLHYRICFLKRSCSVCTCIEHRFSILQYYYIYTHAQTLRYQMGVSMLSSE